MNDIHQSDTRDKNREVTGEKSPSFNNPVIHLLKLISECLLQDLIHVQSGVLYFILAQGPKWAAKNVWLFTEVSIRSWAWLNICVIFCAVHFLFTASCSVLVFLKNKNKINTFSQIVTLRKWCEFELSVTLSKWCSFAMITLTQDRHNKWQSVSFLEGRNPDPSLWWFN